MHKPATVSGKFKIHHDIMEQRLERALEKVVHTLQQWSGTMDSYRLQRRIMNSGGDNFYELDFLIKRLIQLEFVEKNNMVITLTEKGWKFFNFNDVRHEEYREQKAKDLAEENLRLQNETLAFQNSSQGRQAEIDKLTIENLKLQNKQLKHYILYSIIAFLAGAVITNYKELWAFVESLIKS